MSTGEVSSVTGELKPKIEVPCLFIRISKQPPPHVFSDEWFDVGFDLSSSFPPDIPAECIELCANIHPNIDGVCSDEPVRQNKDVEIHLATQSDLINLPDGQAIVKCRIKSPSVKEGMPVAYNLKFFQRMRQTGAIIQKVDGAVSNKVQIVSYKLSLECNWGSNIFYKDEGGKDKHLPTVARLLDQDENVVKGIHVPLKVSLVYDNEEGSSVLQEDKILRLLETTKHYIDPDSGLSIIKFRIEDVSKNHQGLKFKLVVSPIGNRSMNVGFAVTPGISVRSKRNKRTLSSSSSPSRKKSIQQSVVSPGSMVHGENVEGSMIGSCASTPSREFAHIKSPSRAHPATDLNMAFTQVSEWAKEVSRILPTLNWTLIGYCQNVDGSVDYSKPNHLMPYPNDCIKRLTKSYSNNIFQCLEILQNGIDQGLIANNDRVTNGVGENVAHQNGKMIDPNFRSSSLLQSPNAESKMYRDYSMASNILPTPLHQMSPLPATTQNHNNDEERKHTNSWNRNKFNNHDSGEYNEQLKKIDFIFAKHLLSNSGEKLGFPVCDVNKELIGFFRESDVGEPRFSPIANVSSFDINRKNEVNKIVEEAINQRSEAIHRLKDYGTLASLFDHVMVYDWSREFSQHA